MTKRDYKAELEKLGYEVGRPMEDTLFVRGFGVATYVPESDTQALDSLVDPKAHAQRKKQDRNG